MDLEGWETLRASLKGVETPAVPPELDDYGRGFGGKAPWMACIKPDWNVIFHKTVGSDPDGWARVHMLDVYVKAQDSKTNWEMVIVATDTRSEVNN